MTGLRTLKKRLREREAKTKDSKKSLNLEALEPRVLLSIIGVADANGPYNIDEGMDLPLSASGSGNPRQAQ